MLTTITPVPLRRLVALLREADPDASVAEIARAARCSRERARQLLASQGLRTVSRRSRFWWEAPDRVSEGNDRWEGLLEDGHTN